MEKQNGKTRVFSLRIDNDVYKNFKKQVENEGRTVTKVIRNLMIEYLKKNS